MQRDVADVCHMPCECGNSMSHATCLWQKYVTCNVFVAIVCHMQRDVATVCHKQRDVAEVCHMQRDVAIVCHMQRDVAMVCHMQRVCGRSMSHAT